MAEEKEKLHCSFCGKSQDEVKKLVAGRGVYICDECIEVCISIVSEEIKEMEKGESRTSDLLQAASAATAIIAEKIFFILIDISCCYWGFSGY